MTDSFPYEAVFNLIESNIGMAIHDGNRDILRMRIDRMIQEQPLNPDQFFLTLRTEPELMQNLFDRVLTHETSFCREPRGISFAAEHLKHRHEMDNDVVLRVLSAGCSSGEEVYSLRMEILNRFPDMADSIRLHGIDLSPSCIDRARKGRYSAHTVRDVALADLDRFFHRESDGSFCVEEKLKQHVRFTVANLLTHQTGGEMYDMILCRNLLMYLSDAKRLNLLNRMKNWLRKDGILLLAAAETLREIPPGLISERTASLFFYRRDAGGLNDQSAAGR